MNFSPMSVGEVLPRGFDMVRNLGSGVSIATATFSATVLRGANASSAGMISGGAMINGSKVANKIAALVPGYYEIKAVITTSDGNTWIERGTLEVVA